MSNVKQNQNNDGKGLKDGNANTDASNNPQVNTVWLWPFVCSALFDQNRSLYDNEICLIFSGGK